MKDLVKSLFRKQAELKIYMRTNNLNGYISCRAEIKALVLNIKKFSK